MTKRITEKFKIPRALQRMAAMAALLLCVWALVGCRTGTPKVPQTSSFKASSITTLRADTKRGKRVPVRFTAYVLGSEHQVHSKNPDRLIIVLGEKPISDPSAPNRLIIPEISGKLRAVEDGYNRDVLRRIKRICDTVRVEGKPITIYGHYSSSNTFYQYTGGTQLDLSAIEVDGTMINSDFDDQTQFSKKFPAAVKGVVKGGKKIFGLFGKLL